MRPGALAKMLDSKPSRGRKGGGEGRGAQRQGAHDCKQGRARGRWPWDLQGGIQSLAHGPIKQGRVAMVQPSNGTVLFQPHQRLAREGTTEPTKGMVVVRGQEGMINAMSGESLLPLSIIKYCDMC